jgi:hypothetical protein
VSDKTLPSIPLFDIRRGGVPALAHAAPRQLNNLAGCARRVYSTPLLTLADHASRAWLRRNASPYLGEIEAIAGLLDGRGAYALNTSYEWSCTTGAGVDPDGGMRMLRVLDWGLPGLGANLAIALQSGPAGDFINITWPGFVGVLTAMAPGRFAAAINQPPMSSMGMTMPVDWAINRMKVWWSGDILPAHLLRHVFETCPTYAAAKQALTKTPICIPAFFTLAGTAPGEGCVIERRERHAAVREAPSAVANHWTALPQRGAARGLDSEDRQRTMERVLVNGKDWRTTAILGPPIVSGLTRLIAIMNPANESLHVQGFEWHGPATAPLSLSGARPQSFVPVSEPIRPN